MYTFIYYPTKWWTIYFASRPPFHLYEDHIFFRCLWLIDTTSVSSIGCDFFTRERKGLKSTYSTFLTSNSNTSIHLPWSCIVHVYDLFIVVFLVEANLDRLKKCIAVGDPVMKRGG
jgi:hypothetical protein